MNKDSDSLPYITSNSVDNDRGFVLITVLLFLAIFAVLSLLLMSKITSTIKISGLAKAGSMRFHGAEGGALAVSSYMTKYKRTDAPLDVLSTPQYTATVKVLGDSISYPVGYSSLWKGANIQVNSVSPPVPNDKNEVEMIVFVPISPVGYGND